jgi:hypothetical protein
MVRFKFDTPFEREIKQEVFKIVRRGREFGTPGYLFRVFLYVTFYFVSEALWVSKGSSITLAIILGLVSNGLASFFVLHGVQKTYLYICIQLKYLGPSTYRS